MKSTLLSTLFLTLFALTAMAEEVETYALAKQFPANEKAFVDVVEKLNKNSIVELLGEPAKADDIKLKDSGRVVASVWHYHNINTAEDGSVYPTTEIDFIDDKVVMVVFLNNDGSEKNDNKPYNQPQEELDGDGSVEKLEPSI